MSPTIRSDLSRSAPVSHEAAGRLEQGKDQERSGAILQAMESFECAIAMAERSGENEVLAESLRRLAILRHHRDDHTRARELSQRSLEVAKKIGSDRLSAEALNTIGGLHLTAGQLGEARRVLLEALDLGKMSRELRARVEQNLGILANIQGDLYEALTRYERSLAAYRACSDEHGCAIAYHNLGMISADRKQYDAADGYYKESLAIAEKLGDVYLQGLALTNQAEVDVARQRFENATQNAERALAFFDQMGARGAKADAYRVIGMVYRDTGRLALAESRLRSAIELAMEANSILNEAEACREMALLYQLMSRNPDALRMLNTAHRLFRRLDARVDLVHVGGKVTELEATYLAVVRGWGRSLESRDNYTFGHSERVAQQAVALAQLMGLDQHEVMTINFGAYLHDIGMVRVPHEILRKSGALNRDEMELVRMHPLWGLELLSNVDFPWDVRPVIRWHHERYDGTGYPDRLRGDEIPLSAQIVGILDVYDAMMTSRPHQVAFTSQQALARISLSRDWWSKRVYEAFLEVISQSPEGTKPA
ncbi:MAG TPA: HD domain-containing phosphohydrolase [Gemmatimonadales bacterium]